MEFQRKYSHEITGIVDEDTAKLINAKVDVLKQEPSTNEKSNIFTVVGEIKQPDGTPYVNGLVRAFDKDMRSEDLLREAKLENNGKYGIEYEKSLWFLARRILTELIIS